jgi:origin recognition complex subunit 6
MRVLQLYKDRFVEKLPDSDKSSADFSRPVFLAVAFTLVARKNKVKPITHLANLRET